jgi:tubulysin polyketide synthase-like protein
MDAAPPTNDARSVLEELRGRGVVLWNEAERLRFRAPEGVMTADVVDRLRTHKSQIMRLLEAERAGVTPPVLRSRPRPESHRLGQDRPTSRPSVEMPKLVPCRYGVGTSARVSSYHENGWKRDPARAAKCCT